jgi:protease-4
MNKRKFNSHRPLFSTNLPQGLRKPKIKWKIFPILKLALRRTALFLGTIVLINLLIVGLASLFIPSSNESAFTMPNDAVLFLKFDEGFSEVPEMAGFSDPFAAPKPTLQQLVDALDHAVTDTRVKGLIARMEGGSFDLTHSYEIRAALKRFRAAGKFAYIYSSSYGEGGGGLGRYYLASAFDEIWMQPLGMVAITGVSAEIPFARDALEKLGVTPQFFQRKEYKSAYESITNSKISEPNKEELTALVADIRKEILREVPADRKMSTAKFEALINKGLIMSDEALKSGLIDHADYGDVLLDTVAEKVYGKRDADLINLVDMGSYIGYSKSSSMTSLVAHRPKVALVYAVGAIMPSAGEGGDFSGSNIAAADEIAPVLHDIAKDENIDAVVVRIDSPGGSPTASESILRGIEKVRAAGKPVIVSMGSAAASGGYWIASSADQIFALPNTLTGSIGVVGGKFALDALSQKLGVNWEKIEWGQNAGIWSMSKPFTPSEAERMNAMMDHVYDSFKDRVAKGRKMDPAKVEKIARGRVWTGRRALEVGLVDQIGGLNEATDYTATLLGHKSRNDLNIVIMPKPKTTFEALLETISQGVSAGGFGYKAQQALGAYLQPVLQMIAMQKNPSDYTVYNSITLD